MIAIYSVEHLAIALWNAAERDYELEHGYSPEAWSDALDDQKAEYRERAQAIVADCLEQAQALLK